MPRKRDPDHEVVPIAEEHVVIRKRTTPAGGVRVRTEVRETEKVVDEPLAHEDVEVERVRLDRWVEAPVPTRQEGDTTIITLLEEVVVVEKRLRAVEELRITKRRSLRHEPQTVTLRREEAVVEHLDPAAEHEGEPD